MDVSDMFVVVGFVGDVCDVLLGIFDVLFDGVYVKVDGLVGMLICVLDVVGCKCYLWIGLCVEVDVCFVVFVGMLLVVLFVVWDWFDVCVGELCIM